MDCADGSSRPSSYYNAALDGLLHSPRPGHPRNAKFIAVLDTNFLLSHLLWLCSISTSEAEERVSLVVPFSVCEEIQTLASNFESSELNPNIFVAACAVRQILESPPDPEDGFLYCQTEREDAKAGGALLEAVSREPAGAQREQRIIACCRHFGGARGSAGGMEGIQEGLDAWAAPEKCAFLLSNDATISATAREQGVGCLAWGGVPAALLKAASAATARTRTQRFGLDALPSLPALQAGPLTPGQCLSVGEWAHVRHALEAVARLRCPPPDPHRTFHPTTNQPAARPPSRLSVRVTDNFKSRFSKPHKPHANQAWTSSKGAEGAAARRASVFTGGGSGWVRAHAGGQAPPSGKGPLKLLRAPPSFEFSPAPAGSRMEVVGAPVEVQPALLPRKLQHDPAGARLLDVTESAAHTVIGEAALVPVRHLPLKEANEELEGALGKAMQVMGWAVEAALKEAYGEQWVSCLQTPPPWGNGGGDVLTVMAQHWTGVFAQRWGWHARGHVNALLDILEDLHQRRTLTVLEAFATISSLRQLATATRTLPQVDEGISTCANFLLYCGRSLLQSS